MTESAASKQDLSKSKFSRRDFLKVAGAAVGVAALIKYSGILHEGAAMFDLEARAVLEPQISHGVEIYGLNKEIHSKYQMRLLYDHFDRQFMERLPSNLVDKPLINQKEAIFGQTVRTLEIGIRKSDYLHLQDQLAQKSMDFSEWINIHVALMNRSVQNTKPPAEINTKLLRIIVVADDFTYNDFEMCKDMDGAYPINKGYTIINPYEVVSADNYWTFFHEPDGRLRLERPNYANQPDHRQFWFVPAADGSVTQNRDGTLVDWGLIHEWNHRAWNLPDEYNFDLHNLPLIFTNFYLDTGAFHEPRFSPYLSYLVRRANNHHQRGFTTSGDESGLSVGDSENFHLFPYNDIPSTMYIHSSNNADVIQVVVPELQKTDNRFGLVSLYYGTETFDMDHPMTGANGAIIIHDDDMRKSNMDVPYTSKTILVQSGDKTVFLPSACLNMSKIAGFDSVSYDIEFRDVPNNPTHKTQIMQFVDESDLPQVETYARMKITGTNTYAIWLTREKL